MSCSSADSGSHGNSLQQHNATNAGVASSSSSSGPSQNSKAFAEYIIQLGHSAASADNAEEQFTAALRLLANAYSVLVSHLSGGTRIGAAAAEKLDLFVKGATQTYQHYPGMVDRDVWQVLKQCVNEAGVCLSSEQKEVVFQELPRAFRKAGLMLAALAHED